MDLLYWKLGPRRFRESGDGGDGDGDGDGGADGSDGDNGEGGSGGGAAGANGTAGNSGVDGAPAGAPAGNDDDSEAGFGPDWGSNFGTPDFGVDYGVPDVASYDMSLGIPSLAETTVTAEDESSSPDWGGVASNVGLRGLGAVTGIPVGLMRGLAAVMNNNTATPTQISLINSIMSLSPLAPVNAIAGLFGYDIGTAVAGMPGVAANSVGPGPSGASQETWGRGGNLEPMSGLEGMSGPDGQGSSGLTSLFGSSTAAGGLLSQNDSLGNLWKSMKVNNQVIDDGFLKKLLGGS